MANHDIIVIGASAGGLQAMQSLVALLPDDLNASIFVVQHFGTEGRSFLPQILGRAGKLPVEVALDGAPIQRGMIYTAQPDSHLLLEHDHMRVIHGPKENRHRPAIDVLFRSAAWAYGPRVVGVVLSGMLDDGSSGLWAIRSCGGVSVVQDINEAAYPAMPANAARTSEVDHILPVREIATLLVQLSNAPADERSAHRPEKIRTELGYQMMTRDINDMSSIGRLSAFTCPSCHGALWELEDDGNLRYRCHTGHAFSKESLVDDQSGSIEEALYSALRAVEEKATILRRLSDRHQERSPGLMKEYGNKAQEMDETAEVLRGLLAGQGT